MAHSLDRKNMAYYVNFIASYVKLRCHRIHNQRHRTVSPIFCCLFGNDGIFNVAMQLMDIRKVVNLISQRHHYE